MGFHRLVKSQNNSPRNGNQRKSNNIIGLQYAKSVNAPQKKTRFSTNDVNLQKRSSMRRNKTNYLESVSVLKIVEKKIYKMIEIITENEFKIRCTPTHLFWVVGKGWGCFDPKSRVSLE